SARIPLARGCDAAYEAIHRARAGMARFDGFSPRGIARRGVRPVGTGRDLRGYFGNGARRADRIAPGPPVRPALPAQPGGNMNAIPEPLRLLEALLFAAAELLSEEALAERLGAEANVPALLCELAESYAGRGVNLVRLAGGWA